MQITTALEQTRQKLIDSDVLVGDYELETELILRQASGLSRLALFLSLKDELENDQEESLRQIVGRRLKGEPLAYIIGHQEFCKLDFLVNPNVLVPRPETEMLVRRAITLASQRQTPPEIADIGTGSGAIAISLAMNLRQARIFAVDISPPALEVAYFNRRWYGLSDTIQLLQGDLLAPLGQPVDIIVANLPYVSEPILRDFPNMYEPGLALAAGSDGLSEIRRLCHQAKHKIKPGGSLILEIGTGQQEQLSALLADIFPGAAIEISPDFKGLARMATVSTLPSNPSKP